MRHRLLLAVALVAGCLPAVSYGSVRPARDDAATRRAAIALLGAGLPVDPAMRPAGSAEFDGPVPDVAVTGDIDGDGGADVARIVTVFDYVAWESHSWLHLYAGRNGGHLWGAPLPDNGLAFPVFTKVGAAGRQGMLLVSYGDPAVSGPRPVTVTASDNTGTQWTFGGHTAARVVTMTDHPRNNRGVVGTVVYGVGNLVRGGGTDLLIGTVFWRPRGADTSDAWAVRFEVVDGADGTARPLGDVITETSSGGMSATVVGDVDGDGLDDVALTSGSPQDKEQSPVLRVLSSASGDTVWTVQKFPDDDDAQPLRLPDVTGDGVADLAVRVSFDVAEWVGHDPTVTIIDGKSGKPRWTRPGIAVEPLDGGAVLAVRQDRGAPFATTAYSRSGRTLWSSEPKALAPKTKHATVHRFDWAGPVGDVDGDGHDDYGYAQAVTANGRPEGQEGVVLDGRTGRHLARYDEAARGSGVAVDGRGPDLVSAIMRDGVLTVTAWQGRTRHALWRSSVRLSRTSYTTYDEHVADVRIAHLDRDRCADVVVSLGGMTTGAVSFAGATGRAAWALDREGDPEAIRPAGRVPARRYC